MTDRPTPNAGLLYQPAYRGGKEIPSVRVRYIVRAADARNARWDAIEAAITQFINKLRRRA